MPNKKWRWMKLKEMQQKGSKLKQTIFKRMRTKFDVKTIEINC
jgi:hypothetical protein